MVSSPLQTDHVRCSNRLLVYRALADGESASRAALSQRTGLSIPTVASILQELGAIGAVRPDGLADGTGGRPAQRVALEPDARHILAVDLAGRTARALRIDLLGRPRSDHRGPELRPGFEPALIAWLAALLDAPETPPVARLAVAVPGVIDPTDGHVDLAPALGWHDFGLAELLETALGRPTLLENSVNALAVAELGYGVGIGADHVIYVSIGTGIGAALVVHGRLLRGAHAAAGEIGSSLTPMPARGACGEEGAPLERDLLSLADRFLDADGRVCLDGNDGSEAFVRFAESLRCVLHNLACALDPQLLVVAWPADPDGLLVKHLRGRWSGPAPLRIVSSVLGSAAAARGVAHLALERVQEELCRQAGQDPGAADADAAAGTGTSVQVQAEDPAASTGPRRGRREPTHHMH